MSCYYPRKAFVDFIDRDGKKHISFVRSDVEVCTNSKGIRVYDFFNIPCGHCVGCKLDYSRQWAIRCCLEASFYDSNYFLTLTYDDEHNPRSLSPSDIKTFIKSLNKSLNRDRLPSFRYLLAGEYGSQSLRPHYHMICFNLPIDDLVLYKKSPTGSLYTSERLNSLWNKGNIIIAEVTFNTCAYVSRYCLKKFEHCSLESLGFTPEFVHMSRRPGIGFGYFQQNMKSIYDFDKIYFNFGDFNTSNPPKYFDNLLKKLDPLLLEKVKDVRVLKSNLLNTTSMLQTSLTDSDYLRVQESKKLSEIRLLKRSSI